eukprot:gene693-854_t
MSILPKESIKIIAECAGIQNLNEEIAVQLSSDVEYRIREIAQEAIKFMKHSKREYLSTEDINNALRLRNIEVLYGYSSSSYSSSTTTTPNTSTQPSDAIVFSKTQTPTQAIYYIQDKELNFQDIIHQPLPKCPREPTLAAHWLALEGVQPLIPQNPSPLEKEEYLNSLQKKQRTSSTSSTTSTTTTTTSTSTVQSNNNNKQTNSNKEGEVVAGISNLQNTTTVVKPTVKHVLSKEIQMFYEKITSSIKGESNEMFDAAISSLEKDSSLHQLLPYFTNFISVQVTQNLTNLNLLTRLMRMSRAILENKFLRPELYLHQMMPAILTCLVGRKLCSTPQEDHWKLRDFSAQLISFVCRKFGDSYSSLQGRITKTLVQTLHDTSKPLTTHYGAVVGLAGLGRNVIQFLLLPYIPQFYKHLEPELTNTTNQLKSYEAEKVLNAIINSIGIFFSWVSEGENILTIVDMKDNKKIPTSFDYDSILMTLQSNYQSLFELFGEKLIPFIKKKESIIIS